MSVVDIDEFNPRNYGIDNNMNFNFTYNAQARGCATYEKRNSELYY